MNNSTLHLVGWGLLFASLLLLHGWMGWALCAVGAAVWTVQGVREWREIHQLRTELIPVRSRR